MADPKNPGFLAQIGLGAIPEQALFQQAMMRGGSMGGGQQAAFMNLGRQAGAAMAPGLAGAIGALAGKGFNASAQQFKDTKVAGELGIPVEQLQRQRAVREQISKLRTPDTGDEIADQMVVARQAVRIANQMGDGETAMKAMTHLASLERQKQEFEKAGLAIEAQRTSNLANYNAAIRNQFEGFAANIVGEDTENVVQARVVTDPDDPNFGMFEVFRPGQEEPEYRDGGVIPAKTFSASSRKPASIVDHIKQYITTKDLRAVQESVSGIEDRAQILKDITDAFSSSPDPQLMMSFAGKGLVGTDKVVRTVDAFAGLIGNRALTWENEDGKTIASYGSAEEMQQRAEKVAATMLQGINLSEDWASIKETMGAEQFEAMIMQLAFLDARLMEPSNRGLSDKDIENALKRLVGGSANPVSFLTRQRQWVANMEAKMGTIGSLIPPGQWTTEEIRANMVNTASLDRAAKTLAETRAQIDTEIARLEGADDAPSLEVGSMAEWEGQTWEFTGGNRYDQSNWRVKE